MTGRAARGLIVAWVASLLLAACAATEPSPVGITDPPPVPPLDQESVAAGEAIYMQYCAECHGADLAGQPDWRQSNDDGSYPPPPHDSSGHSWHHPDQALLEITRDGIDLPQSRMPIFRGQLSDEQILSVLDFLKSRWGSQEREFQWQVTWQETQRRN